MGRGRFLDEYQEIDSLKNPRWKTTTMVYPDVYSSGVVWDKK